MIFAVGVGLALLEFINNLQEKLENPHPTTLKNLLTITFKDPENNYQTNVIMTRFPDKWEELTPSMQSNIVIKFIDGYIAEVGLDPAVIHTILEHCDYTYEK